MIMESQGAFYMNLYRSRNVNLDNTESSTFFDSPNLPSISHESRIICEGRTTAEECQKVLKTFPSAKRLATTGYPSNFTTPFGHYLVIFSLIPLMKLLRRRKCPHLKDKQ